MGLASRLREVLEEQVLVLQEEGEAKLQEKDIMEVKVIQIPAASTVVDIRKMGQLRLKGLKPGVSDSSCFDGGRHSQDGPVEVEGTQAGGVAGDATIWL